MQPVHVQRLQRKRRKDQMKVFPKIFCTSSAPLYLGYSPLRYTVYIAEARKRLIYVGLSFILAILCAYTERVALMYYTTVSLQQVLPKKNDIENVKIKDLTDNLNNDQVEYSTLGLSDAYKKAWNHIFQNQKTSEVGQEGCRHDLQDMLYQQENSSISFPEFLPVYQEGGVRLIFTDVEEAFYTLLYVCVFWCVLACLPVLIYQVWCFLQPGIHAWKSERVRFFLLKKVFFVYLLLWLVDQLLLPRLLSFFYSFEIERASLSLHAETKILSYVSLYVFVNLFTLMLCFCTVIWRFYRQKDILYSLRAFSSFKDNLLLYNRSNNYLTERAKLGFRYRDQRSRLWWACLLVSSLISPPEVSSQLSCALLLILLNEVSVCLAYLSSCRLSHQMQ
ncbi:MAG: hypothetical protein EOP45_00230 [Sphingobacteriaceae bacterium]|nr:MAG: hypothetical protein EOP45_00230 [Sphingobacteriaceae bacterium]